MDRGPALLRVEVIESVAPVRERQVIVDADEIDVPVRPERIEMEIHVTAAIAWLMTKIFRPIGGVADLCRGSENGPDIGGQCPKRRDRRIAVPAGSDGVQSAHLRSDQEGIDTACRRAEMAERIREYEAMLTVIGYLSGAVDPPPPMTTEKLREQVADAIREAGGSLIERSKRSTLDNLNPMNAITSGVGLVYGISGGIADLLGFDEAAEGYYDTARTALNTDVVALYNNAVNDLVVAIWEGLTDYWDRFWETADSEGFLIAFGKLRIDAGFLAAELAIDIALGVATGGAAAAASRVIRVVGRRVASTVTRVTVKIGRVGEFIPDTQRVLQLDVPDEKIPANIERLLDEDNLGGAAKLDDTAQRAEAKPTTPETTRIQGDSSGEPPRPRYTGRALTSEERARARAATPTRALRNMVNSGEPIATPANPVPDPWLVGLNRVAPLEPDHIVPLSHILDKPGFSDLTPANQDIVTNLAENFHGLSRSANGSRGNKTFEEWTMHVKTGIPVTPELRQRMIAEEARMNEVIQRKIDELLHKQQSANNLGPPFRDDVQ